MEKDLLSMPAESFYYNRLTYRERDAELLLPENERFQKPYSLILSQAIVDDFEDLVKNISCFYSSYDDGFIHFSLFDCYEDKIKFKNNEVLTVNVLTGEWKWRKPYNWKTLPK
jgi:hypothetical protein